MHHSLRIKKAIEMITKAATGSRAQEFLKRAATVAIEPPQDSQTIRPKEAKEGTQDPTRLIWRTPLLAVETAGRRTQKTRAGVANLPKNKSPNPVEDQ